ncbi:DUF5686 and carboxypeptidase regulatory-like domain-containing protein [Echinicola shivajiensis]|uniref:DUF5686 and carboxypeptidase regulatory-like domain-containing protein n=1 Tax=Echinicola shivajiensis TaxID=1035916 RepID=UPI001BFC65CE|nr:DUF5686 and carboxypeptidase regulatory-like domain-containing protein [Echinicola shivajiensis]
MLKTFYFIFICLFTTFFLSILALGQGIKGKVMNEAGEPLAYASIFIRNLNDGVPANQEGAFEIELAPGYYDVIVQHLGYKFSQKTVVVNDLWEEIEFVLEPQMYALEEVEIRDDAEDPALTVMRKAIAKAKYHRLQVDEYSMKVYIKGTGELTDAPFFLRKKLKEEGVALNEAYTSESVSEITFKQPNEISEKVISIRTTGESNQTSPAPYIGASFYADKINEVVSPLSKSAFAYYRFKHEGTFYENGVLINKIRVVPRSRGEQVFEGHVYIIEDIWAIHSLELRTSFMGFDIGVRQQYAMVAKDVWMPLTHLYSFSGKFFGFKGHYKYLASTRDYEIKLNPDLIVDTEILDEHVEIIPEDVEQISAKETSVEDLGDMEQLSRKDFRKVISQYEKQSLKERKDAEVIVKREYSIDSLAEKRNKSYWDSIRPVKLTQKEILGYQRDDSLAKVESAKKSNVDSLANEVKRKFKPLDILIGGRYFFGNGVSVGFKPNWSKVSFNTVEGVKVGFGGYFKVESMDSVSLSSSSWSVSPELRYGFSSNQFYGMVDFKKSWSSKQRVMSYGMKGGSYIYQFNSEDPINEQVNAFYSLFFRQNYMKLYDQKFIQLYFEHKPSEAFSYQLSMSYTNRNTLENSNSYSFYNKSGRAYASNRPENIEAADGAFASNESLILDWKMELRPGLKYYVRNKERYAINSTAPLISIVYRKGLANIGLGEEAADFDQLELGAKHGFKFGVSGKLEFNIKAGGFINNENLYFMDYKHFGGNRTIFSNMGTVNNYRLLDYYKYSTKGNYLSSIVHYQFRKLLFTQFPMLRFSGLRENLFVNYLKTEESPHYWEVGYSLDNLFRLFRVEFGLGFENSKYQRSGVRIGVASFININ